MSSIRDWSDRVQKLSGYGPEEVFWGLLTVVVACVWQGKTNRLVLDGVVYVLVYIELVWIELSVL